jgi:hypothetical protein
MDVSLVSFAGRSAYNKIRTAVLEHSTYWDEQKEEKRRQNGRAVVKSDLSRTLQAHAEAGQAIVLLAF